MVSAATGAALVAHLPAGQDRLTLLLGCYAMFGVSLLAALIIIGLLWARLPHSFVGIGPAKMVPTLWIVLGPLGQSVTAAALLGWDAAPAVLQRPRRSWGVSDWPPALRRTRLGVRDRLACDRRRDHDPHRRVRTLPFSLTWWSFTFPVGTVATGTIALAARGSPTLLLRDDGGGGGAAGAAAGAGLAPGGRRGRCCLPWALFGALFFIFFGADALSRFGHGSIADLRDLGRGERAVRGPETERDRRAPSRPSPTCSPV